MIGELRKVLKPVEVMLVCARWYAAYPLSFRHLEEMMHERGVFVDNSTVHLWSLKIRFFIDSTVNFHSLHQNPVFQID